MRQRKKWKELSTGTKRRIGVMALVQFALLVAALWDLRRRPAEEIRGSKRMWLGIVFINLVGPIAYFLFGRKPSSAPVDTYMSDE